MAPHNNSGRPTEDNSSLVLEKSKSSEKGKHSCQIDFFVRCLTRYNKLTVPILPLLD